MSADDYATKADHESLEKKVDTMNDRLTVIGGDLRSIREANEARDRLEARTQIMTAEVNLERAKLEASKQALADAQAANAAEWNRLKSRALYGMIALCLISTYPGLVSMVQKARSFLP